MRLVLIFLFLILVLQNCRKDSYELNYKPINVQYFNSVIGNYSIYKVDEIRYDDFTNKIDTLKYQILEVNQSVFKDNLGRNAIRIERYERLNDSLNWKYLNTCYTVAGESRVERVEDNKRFIKLSFPISNEAFWNANAFNSENSNNVFYGLLHQNYKLDTFRFDSVISVEISPIKNLSKERVFEEIYAKNIGMVYKYYVILDKSGSPPLQIQKGFKIRYTLIKHG